MSTTENNTIPENDTIQDNEPQELSNEDALQYIASVAGGGLPEDTETIKESDDTIQVDNESTVPEDETKSDDTPEDSDGDETKSDDEDDGDDLSSNNDVDDDDNELEDNVPNDEDTEDDDKTKSEDKETEPEEPIEEPLTEAEADTRLKELEEFYNTVTQPFKANGKEHLGIKDPKQLIKAQQKAIGFDKLSKKVAPLKPFMSKMEELGLLADSDKMNLILEIAKGNPDAIKKHLSDLKLDPESFIEYDESGDLKYDTKGIEDNSEPEIIQTYKEYVDSFGDEKSLKVFTNEVVPDWDEQSIQELIENPHDREAFKEHIDKGIYPEIMKYVDLNKRIDVDNKFSKMSSLEQYNKASLDYLESLKSKQTKGVKEETKIVDKKPRTKSKRKKKQQVDKIRKASDASQVISSKSQQQDSIAPSDEDMVAYIARLAEN